MLMVATIINVIWIIKPCWVLTWDENGVWYNIGLSNEAGVNMEIL